MSKNQDDLLPSTRLVTETQAAEILGLSVKTLRRWRWQRRGITWVKIGEAVRYSTDDLQAYIESRRHEVTHA